MPTSDFLEQSLQTLSNKIGSLNEHKCEAGKIFEAQHKAILEAHAQLPEWSIQAQKGKLYLFHFSSPSTGTPLSLQGKHFDLSAQLELNTIQKLKVYQWLLVEAYEAIEDFLEKAYAYCGSKGMELWERPNKWQHGSSEEIDHYLSVELRGTPYAQLKAFRTNLHHFAKYESTNPNQVNYRVVFVLIEKLRHFIVHNEGYGQDFDKLMTRIRGELPGVDSKQLKNHVDSFFTLHGDRYLVDLLEFPVEDPTLPIGAYHDQMLGLFRNIMEYAVLITEGIYEKLLSNNDNLHNAPP